MLVPGPQKTLDQFRADEAACRDYAQAALGGPNAARAANDAAAANAAAGTVLGAAAGAIIGSASGQAGPGAAVGAGFGLLAGSAAGSNAAGYSSYSLQRQFDIRFTQCMYSRGNHLPGRVAYRAPAPRYQPNYLPPPPGTYPPPNYPAPAGVAPGQYPPPNYPPPGTPAPGG